MSTGRVVVGLLAPFLSGCYVWSQALGQFHVALHSARVDALLARGEFTPEERARLEEIDRICRFGEERIGLVRDGNYTRYYDPGGPYISYAVTVAASDRLALVTWSYPIVGSVSYRGYFDREDAEAEADAWREDGYDVYMRGVRAYSTLGWFSDPILPWMLEEGIGPLAETLLHEMCHARLFVSGETSFNESLASFVGHEAGRAYVREAYGEGSSELAALDAELADRRTFDDFMRGLYGRLQRAYAAAATAEERLTIKGREFAESREDFRRQPWTDGASARFADREWNHALLLANAAYGDYHDFEALFRRCEGDWEEFWRRIDAIAEEEEPWDALRASSP